MTTFSSNISRIRQCVDAAIKFNRKIIFMGRSMKENTKLASEIGYLPIPKTLMMNEEDVPRVPPNKICLIVAGSQGQYNSALSKLAHKKNSSIKIQNGDKVIISSDPIPGNEDEVYTLIEELTLQGADVIYPDIQDQLHASGHGNREDLKFLIRFTDPKYFIPIGGTIRHQRQYERIVESLGYDTKNAFMLKEGETVWFEKAGAHFGEVIETKNIYVDAYGIGDVGNIVLRDRKTLSTEGIVVAFLMIDNQGNLVTRPKILTRGFIFQKDEDKLIEDGVRVIEKMMTPNPGQLIDINGIKKETETNLEEYLFKQRGRRPLIIVDVIQV
ncbi:MAG: ribonuclease J [Actinomycetota bacterium]